MCAPIAGASFEGAGGVAPPALSTGRMDPRVGSGRVWSRFCRILAGRVESGQLFGFCSFLLIISYYHNGYESLNTTFRLICFYDIYLIIDN